MNNRKSRAFAAGVAAAVVVTVPAYTAYAAGGSPAAATGASTSSHPNGTARTKSATKSSSATPTVTPYSPPAAPGHSPSPTAESVTPSGHFSVKVDKTGKKPMDNTWPSASEVFTEAELRQVIPGLTAVKAGQCQTGSLADGGATAKSTTCTLKLTISGESADDRSQLMINIRGFGLPQQIGKQWTKDLAQARARSAKRPGLYTFYPNKALGVSAAFTDGTTTKVLLQHGDVAGEVWFSGIGFTQLTNDYLKSRQRYRTKLVPALVQLLGSKFTTTTKAAS